MADIYAFGPDWALPAPLKEKLDTVVANWVAAKKGLWSRGTLPANTDTTTMRGTDWVGVWEVIGYPESNGITGLPLNQVGALTVYPGAGWQEYRSYADGKRWSRGLLSTTNKTWSPWADELLPKVVVRGTLPNNSDLNTMFTANHEGVWRVGSGASASTMLNLAEPRPGTLKIDWVGGNIASQTFTAYGTGKFWFRIVNNIAGPTWSAWRDLTEVPTPTNTATTVVAPDYMMKHALKKDTLRGAMGGSIGTGGKPWVVLRFDDWPNAFREKVVPLLRERDLPCVLAQAVKFITDESTWGEVKSWNLNDGFQTVNHSLTHGQASADDDVSREILGGADTIESNIPEIRVFGWTMPGTGTTSPYGGYMAATEADYHNTTAGKLILSKHAYVYGVRGGYINPQGAEVIGMGHTTIEKSTLADIQAVVANAKNGSAMLMVHPNRLDQDGYMTTAQLAEILDWLKAERDAGRIIVGTSNAVPMLNPATTYRHNLTTGAMSTFDGWYGSGWTQGSGFVTSPASTGTLSKAVRWDHMKSAAGGSREVHLVVRSATANQVTVRVSSTSGAVEKTRTWDVPGDGQWHDVRTFFTVPVNADVGVNTYVSSAAGAKFDVREINMWSV